MLAVILDSIPLGTAAAVIGLILIAGVVAGQFRRGVISELRASLETATSEIEIQRQRSERLTADVQQLREENAALHAELATLRDMLLTGGHLQKAIVDAITDAVSKSTLSVIENSNALAASVTAQINALQQGRA